jgi:3-hydroxyisobutyrate dehydrogenase-like beta-hydroxyacid dehydrogenase
VIRLISGKRTHTLLSGERRMRRLGFIGLGQMGSRMARRLLQTERNLVVYNRSKGPLELLAKEGATPAASAREVGQKSDTVLLSLTDGNAVKQVIFGEEGLISGMRQGGIIVDTSTIGPVFAREIAELAGGEGINVLDAPVSGGPEGAAAGKLTFMIGGDFHAFHEIRDVFQILGENVFYMGGTGAGQATKLVNQILVGIHIVATCEALLFGQSQGLDLQKTVDVITKSAGDSFVFRRDAPQIMSKSFGGGFQTYIIHKDLRLALDLVSKKPPFKLTDEARKLLEENLKLGNEKVDAVSAIKVLERLMERS